MSPKKAKPKGKGLAPSRSVGTQAGPSAGDRILGYPLPKEVAAAVDRATQANRASNFGLLFHRLLRYPQEWSLEGKEKADTWKNQIVGRALGIFQNATMEGLFEGLQRRMTWVEQGYRQRFGSSGVISFVMTVDWRLAIGLSAASVLETGIALHRIYGIPYLPGSAIKGLTRHYRLTSIAEELGVTPLDPDEINLRRKGKGPSHGKTPWEMLEELLVAEEPADAEGRKALDELFSRLTNDPALLQDGRIKKQILSWEKLRIEHEDFRRALGSQARRGEVLFFDAFPEELTLQDGGRNEPIVELDIINTHYQDYYTKTPPAPPADYLSPIPVYFLTVRAGTPFRFRLAAKDPKLLGKVAGWLKEALQKFGIGAKAMAGYGALFEVEALSVPGGGGIWQDPRRGEP